MKLGDNKNLKAQSYLMRNKELKEYKIKPPSKDKLTKIMDDLYWARLPLPFRLDHVNIFAINSVEGLVIIDTGLNNFETMACWNSIIKNLETNGKQIGKKIGKMENGKMDKRNMEKWKT